MMNGAGPVTGPVSAGPPGLGADPGTGQTRTWTTPPYLGNPSLSADGGPEYGYTLKRNSTTSPSRIT
jgi:hypothetical protein